MPDLDLKEQIRLAEYKSLREEIAAKQKDARTTEQLVLFADAVIYGFIAQRLHGKDDKLLPAFVWWIPFILTLIGALRLWEAVYYIGEASRYLKAVEGWIGDRTMWEGHLENARKEGKILCIKCNQSNLFHAITIIFWVLATGVTFALAMWHVQFGMP